MTTCTGCQQPIDDPKMVHLTIHDTGQTLYFHAGCAATTARVLMSAAKEVAAENRAVELEEAHRQWGAQTLIVLPDGSVG